MSERSAALAAIVNQPPEYALAYMRARGHLLSPSFDWRDVWQDCHTAAFTVAKSSGYNILGDIHAGLMQALGEGRTYRQFAAELMPLLQKKGWWGRAQAVDPLTGQMREVQLGSPRRLRIIYDTNMRTAHAAGEWVRIQEGKATHPFLRYVALLDEKTRLEHRQWHAVILPVDHPWWRTHYPPNGWWCRCGTMQLSPEDMDYFGYAVTEAPEIRLVPWENKRSGETMLVPEGIDPGFAYNVGRASLAAHSARALLGGLEGLPPRLAAEAMADSVRFVLPALREDLENWITALAERIRRGDRRVYNERRVVGALTLAQLDFLEQKAGLPGSGSISLGDRDVLHMQRSGKVGRWGVAELGMLPEILSHPTAILWDLQKPGFLYVHGNPDAGPPNVAVVTVDNRLRVGREKYMVNSLRTTSTQSWNDLRNGGRFRLISGNL